MPNIGHLAGKQVVIKLRDMKPILGAVSTADEHGVWIRGAGDLLSTGQDVFARSQVKTPHFFVPWTTVDWIAMQNE
jgi:hypothetical protein